MFGGIFAEQCEDFSGAWLEGDSLAPPCQAETDVIDAILDLADLDEKSCIFDLGCGDGRICIEATKRFGCRSVGCEIEEQLIEKFQSNILKDLPEHLQNKDIIRVVSGDLRELDLAPATVIVVYLLAESVEEIKPMLFAAMKEQGCRVICNTFSMKHVTPLKVTKCGFCNNVSLYLYDASCIPK